jgi:hypothetical protein
MGSILSLRCAAFLRALLLPALLALAWLIWGAGTAQASSVDSAETVQLNTNSLGYGLLSSGPSSDLTEAVTGTLSPTADEVVPAVASPAAPDLTRPIASTISAAASTTDVIVGGTTGLASSVVKTAAPVVASQADKAVAALDNAAASLDPRLPRIPRLSVPAPVPVPVVTVPDVPAAGVPAQQVRHRAVSTALPAAPAPARPAAPAPPAAAVSTADTAPAVKTAAPTPAVVSVQQSAPRGPTLAQLHMAASARPVAAVAAQPLRYGQLNHSFAVEHLKVAATHGESSPAGSDGPGAQGADIAAFWNGLFQNAGEREHDAAMVLPSNPAFDPGSSPD